MQMMSFLPLKLEPVIFDYFKTLKFSLLLYVTQLLNFVYIPQNACPFVPSVTLGLEIAKFCTTRNKKKQKNGKKIHFDRILYLFYSPL